MRADVDSWPRPQRLPSEDRSRLSMLLVTTLLQELWLYLALLGKSVKNQVSDS